MRVLVTGGAGYIGSHACKALAAAGHEPITYDNLSMGHAWAVKWGPLEQGDLLDPDRLREAVERWRPEAVVHFAAVAYVGESVENPAKYYRNNVVGTLNLLEAMRQCGVGKIVFSSTCATYGNPMRLPLDEHHSQAPINPYGRSKLMIEQVLADYAAAYGMSSIALRYFNAAGADPEGELGEEHDPETHLIPLVLEAAAGLRDAITIFGRDHDTPDGTCVRDYIHVSDLAEAHVHALDALGKDAQARAFNLGTGTGYSVQEVIDAARRVTGRTIPVANGPRRAGDPPILVADATAVRTSLGWQPRHSDLATMLETAWAWTMKQHNRRPRKPLRRT
jgi:UDP-arabinose 4-epimerase